MRMRSTPRRRRGLTMTLPAPKAAKALLNTRRDAATPIRQRMDGGASVRKRAMFTFRPLKSVRLQTGWPSYGVDTRKDNR
ncbi:hypothetical protein ACFPRL_23495 [Pseudoclavibacter helvolus]